MTIAAAAGDGAEALAGQLVDRVRDRPWGLGVVAVHDGRTALRVDEGRDRFTADSLFEIGSVTKTMTGFLLADAVLAGQCALATTVGDVLGSRAGPLADTTFLQLATHTSGLPRLPAGFAPANPADPYADLSRERLLESLGMLPALEPGPVQYSNLGFMLLGVLLEVAGADDYETLLRRRLLEPLGMTATTTRPPETGRLPGYEGGSAVPWWTGLPGAGRVASSLVDMARYVRATLDGDGAPDHVQAAMALATGVHAEGERTVGLGWHHQGGGLWHNGGTGGFHAMALAFRPSGSAVFLVGNGAGLDELDRTAFAVITDLAHGRLQL